MKTQIKEFVAVFLSITILSSSLMSCSSTTRIVSHPSDAKVYVDGAMVGTSPYKHKDFAVSGAAKQVELKKEGYEDFETIMKKNERAHVGAIIGGLFLLFPFIWVVQYDKEHNYEMTPIKPATN